MRITILAAIWGQRLPVELAFIEHHLRLHPELTLSLAVTHGVELPARFASHPRVAWTFADNAPLGAKHNAALYVALTAHHLGARPQYGIVMGSDDFLSLPLLRRLELCADEGAKHVALRDTYFADRVTKTAVYWPGYGPHQKLGLGAGRLVELRAMALAGGWPAGLNRGLDGGLSKNLAHVKLQHPERLLEMSDAGPIVCTKGEANLWKIGAFKNTSPVPFDWVTEHIEYLPAE